MPERFEDILARCIDDVKTGVRTVEECLESYPSVRERLEPLLRTALQIQPLPGVEPSPEFRIKARVRLMEQIHAGRSGTERAEPRYESWRNLTPRKRRFSMVSIIVATIVLAVSAAGGGTVYAAQDSLPGDALYPVKTGTEQVSMMLPGDDVGKAEKALGFAEERVEEMTALAEQERSEHLALALSRYEDALNTALTRIEAARSRGLPVASVSETVAEATARHLGVLDEVYESVPAEARDAITGAREASLNGQGAALAALAQENPVQAAQISMATAEARLNRAMTMAGADDPAEVENALQQYEKASQFGSEISQIAQSLGEDAAAVEELVAEAISRHLSVMDEVKDRVPEQAAPAVRMAQETSVNRLGGALSRLAEERPARAMELNLAAMEERLNRVRAKAATGDVEEVEDALQQFEEMSGFGEDISQTAWGLGKDVAAVEEMVARAATVHLEVLGMVREQVPEEARTAVERAMQKSATGYERAAEALEEIGAPADIPHMPSLPEGVPAPGQMPGVPGPGMSGGSDNLTEAEEAGGQTEQPGGEQPSGPPGGIGGRP